jgi:hypothetical protein
MGCSVVPLEGLKILKCSFPLKFLKIIAEGLISGTNTDNLNSGTLMKHHLFEKCDYFLNF